jgi:hypothetical protein
MVASRGGRKRGGAARSPSAWHDGAEDNEDEWSMPPPEVPEKKKKRRKKARLFFIHDSLMHVHDNLGHVSCAMARYRFRHASRQQLSQFMLQGCLPVRN